MPTVTARLAGPSHEGPAAQPLQGDAARWQLYDNMGAQTLRVGGAQSDLLSGVTARAMTGRGPHARMVQFEGIGHVPTLIAQDQLDVVVGFLLE